MTTFLTDKPLGVLFEYLEQRIGLMWTPDFQALGRVSDGRLVGVIGFNNFNGASCQMHMAGEPRWATRGFIETAFRYVFIMRKLNMAFAFVPSGNAAALSIDLRVGFKELIPAISGAHPDGAMHVLCMRREECRWLGRRTHGQEVNSRAA